MKKQIYFIFFFVLLASCASKPPKENPAAGANPKAAKEAAPLKTPSMETKQLANEEQTTVYTEFEFKKGSEALSQESKDKLKKASQEALAKGKIQLIKIITWGDQEYPSAGKKKLGNDQIALVNQRNFEIKNYLEEIHPKEGEITKFESISMAERPDFFDKFLAADEVKIKKSLETSGIPTTEAPNTKKSKSRKSIILFFTNKEQK